MGKEIAMGEGELLLLMKLVSKPDDFEMRGTGENRKISVTIKGQKNISKETVKVLKDQKVPILVGAMAYLSGDDNGDSMVEDYYFPSVAKRVTDVVLTHAAMAHIRKKIKL